jgi:hypothetical protein
VKELEETNRILREKAKSLHIMLESQREQNIKTQDMVRVSLVIIIIICIMNYFVG